MSGDLRKILEDYQERVRLIEDQKYDCEMAVMRKDFEVCVMQTSNQGDFILILNSVISFPFSR